MELVNGGSAIDGQETSKHFESLETEGLRYCIQFQMLVPRSLKVMESDLERAAVYAARLAGLVSTADEGVHSWLWPAEGSASNPRTMDSLFDPMQSTKVGMISPAFPGLTSHVNGAQTLVMRAVVVQRRGTKIIV